MGGKIFDLTDKTFGRLTVIEFSHFGSKDRYWLCKCECGNKIRTTTYRLQNGRTVSCGCLRTDMLVKMSKKHGRYKSLEYSSWVVMKRRCCDSKNRRYSYYGGRGIKVCEKWMKFELFFEDVGERPRGYTLDRIDNNGDYEPNNCKWSTLVEQARNKSNNVIIKYNGRNICVVEFAKILGLTYATVWQRIRNGWTIDDIVNTPYRQQRKLNTNIKGTRS